MIDFAQQRSFQGDETFGLDFARAYRVNGALNLIVHHDNHER